MVSNVFVQVNIDASQDDGRLLLAPCGMSSPYETISDLTIQGAQTRFATEVNTGQEVAIITPTREQVSLTYQYMVQPGIYTDAMFIHKSNRFTQAAEDLIDEAQHIGADLPATQRIRALACSVAERFTYGHPDTAFYENLDSIPSLGCGVTEGSCVDINTYFIAIVRSAGFEAGYVTGYFFPKEKGGTCEDMHCWVVTRVDNEILEWDIAHHLKLGTRDIHPGLNPKPGRRAAVAHSMGLSVPELGITEMKLLAEPVWVDEDGSTAETKLSIYYNAQFSA